MSEGSQCKDCGHPLPPNNIGRERCPMCEHKHRTGFLPLTDEERSVRPTMPRPELCQHCLENPPFFRSTYVRSKKRAYWLCEETCRDFAGQTGELPILEEDGEIHPTGNHEY